MALSFSLPHLSLSLSRTRTVYRNEGRGGSHARKSLLCIGSKVIRVGQFYNYVLKGSFALPRFSLSLYFSRSFVMKCVVFRKQCVGQCLRDRIRRWGGCGGWKGARLRALV